MKSLRNLIPVILPVLLLFGCSDNGVDPDADLTPTLDFPDDWTRQPGSNMVLLIAVSPAEGAADPFRENINVVAEEYPGTMDFDQYVVASRLSLATAISDYETVEQADTELAGRRAHRMVYTGTLGGNSLYSLVYIVEGSDRAWVITCSARPDSFDRWLETFEGVVATFRLD